MNPSPLSPYDLYINFRKLKSLWPGPTAPTNNVVLSCGFQAVELCWRLVDHALEDGRQSADRAQRLERYTDMIVNGMRTVSQLMVSDSRFAEGQLQDRQPEAPASGFGLLIELPAYNARRIVDSYNAEFGDKPFDVGVGPYIDKTADLLRIPRESDRFRSVTLDYEALVRPQDIHSLHQVEPQSPEDHLFAGVHQITECWLRLVHHFLAEATALAESKLWGAAASRAHKASLALSMAIDAGQLLDLMVLADYHPLRVRLRDGSGAQSAAAQQIRPAGKKALVPLLDELALLGIGPVDVLESPELFPGHFQYLVSLAKFGKRSQEFLFKHYLLALGVMGHRGLGSLGYEVNQMVKRAAAPFFPELDDACHDYAVLMNFAHGRYAGDIISRREAAQSGSAKAVSAPLVQCSASVMMQAVSNYFHFMTAGDAESWVSLFDAEVGRIIDAGSRPFSGSAHLRIFIESFFRNFPRRSTSFSEVHLEGNKVNVKWRYDLTSYNGVDVSVSGTERFIFSESGLIREATADWNPEDLAAQLRSGLKTPGLLEPAARR
ncbi:nuclear transport factor 2 family protein [Streptomyces sp. NPDC004787]|uniref:nuclear transport factor 2 family protein n=1 Tax=Streptomyces sp. NPDC004787 TaxID=3154291 RepID=UPI0033BF9819